MPRFTYGSLPQAIETFPSRLRDRGLMGIGEKYAHVEKDVLTYKGHRISVRPLHDKLLCVESELIVPDGMNGKLIPSDWALHILGNSRDVLSIFNLTSGDINRSHNLFPSSGREILMEESPIPTAAMPEQIKIIDAIYPGKEKRGYDVSVLFNSWFNLTGRRLLYIAQRNGR